jgi:protein-disulfide isomerase
LISLSARIASLAALAALSLSALAAAAQQPAPQQVPDAPTPDASVAAAPAPFMPVFPKPNPADFTAAGPTKEAVDAFFHINWGFDVNRVWQVQAIQKTAIDGVSKVTLLAAEKGVKSEPQAITFFIAVDGKHIISGDGIIRSDEHPYAENRALLQKRADGPYRGSALKDLEIVEFADFQCPHCKEAQANMDRIAADFPKARFVFQNLVLGVAQWKASKTAAAYGVCMVKEGGSDAFFTFASAVFEGQEGLMSADGAALTLNSAVAKAGQDPTKIAACASTPAAIDAVEASKKLALDLGVNQTPTLAINGRIIPANLPYEDLKQLILYQAKLDGVAAQ